MAEELYKDDLYGDLDLEDLDASQLEELVEPPELDPAPGSSTHQPAAAPAQAAVAATSAQPQPAAQYSAAPVPVGNAAQSAPGVGGGYGGMQVDDLGGQGSGQQGGSDRIRPSDMPDEGLVWLPPQS
ncbi:hypothetical protein I317_05968 [Kwoniella heveanensis CBS 569]|nr:hypothetical protein I317_05968 [Kwoniella heveanensis CBS 569]